MKKNIIFALSLILSSVATLNLSSCHDDNDDDDNHAPKSVVTDNTSNSNPAVTPTVTPTVNPSTETKTDADKQTTVNPQNDNKPVVMSGVDVSGNIQGHDYVEIAGVKWSTCPVGASKVGDTGHFYQQTAINSVLAEYGSNWTLPSADDIENLRTSCTWEKTDNYKGTGVAGWVGTCKTNGNTIFFAHADKADKYESFIGIFFYNNTKDSRVAFDAVNRNYSHYFYLNATSTAEQSIRAVAK